MHGKYLPILWYNELVDYRDYREFVTFSNIVVNEKRNGQVVSEKKGLLRLRTQSYCIVYQTFYLE